MNTSLLVIAVKVTTKLSAVDTHTSLHTPTWLISSLLCAAISVNSSEPCTVRDCDMVSVAIVLSVLVFLWCSTIIVLRLHVDFRVLLTDNSC